MERRAEVTLLMATTLAWALSAGACAGEAPRSGAGAAGSAAGSVAGRTGAAGAGVAGDRDGAAGTTGTAGTGGASGAAGTASPDAGAVSDASGAGGTAGDGAAGSQGASSDGGAPSDGRASSDGGGAAGVRLVGYVPNYRGGFASWAKKLSFSKMTHLNLAFAVANASNQWSLGASDADVKAIVDAAHAAGVKVLASLGGAGGDQTVLSRYNDPNAVGPLVDNLDAFLAAHDLDGADIDIESPNNLGKSYSTFVDMVVSKLRPEGKLVTAAVAQYLQGGMADATLREFDFINVMIYSNLSETMKQAAYYVNTKKVPKELVVLGAGFFGNGGNTEYAYADIIKADPAAWSKDQATVQGVTVRYEGVATMRQIADFTRGFGGIMIWELTQDTFDDHSLLKAIQGEL